MISISKEDLQCLMISATRYAWTRQTYIVSLTCDVVEKYLDDLDDNTVKVILVGLRDDIAWRKDTTPAIDLPYMLKLEKILEKRLPC